MPYKTSTENTHVEMTTLEKLPDPLQARLKELLEQEEEIKVVVSTDLKFDGTYGKDWILATEKRLIAFNQNGASAPDVQHILLKQIDALEIRELHGNNIMKVRTSTEGVEVARFSKKYALKFSEATPEIEALIEKVKPLSEEERKRRKNQPAGKKKGQM